MHPHRSTRLRLAVRTALFYECPPNPCPTYLALQLGLAKLNVLHLSLEASLPLDLFLGLEREWEKVGAGRPGRADDRNLKVKDGV